MDDLKLSVALKDYYLILFYDDYYYFFFFFIFFFFFYNAVKYLWTDLMFFNMHIQNKLIWRTPLIGTISCSVY